MFKAFAVSFREVKPHTYVGGKKTIYTVIHTDFSSQALSGPMHARPLEGLAIQSIRRPRRGHTLSTRTASDVINYLGKIFTPKMNSFFLIKS